MIRHTHGGREKVSPPPRRDPAPPAVMPTAAGQLDAAGPPVALGPWAGRAVALRRRAADLGRDLALFYDDANEQGVDLQIDVADVGRASEDVNDLANLMAGAAIGADDFDRKAVSNG